MTKKSHARNKRDLQGIPKFEEIAHIEIDYERKQSIIIKKDLLVNQIKREGPKIARSFDKLTKKEIAECSRILANVQGMLMRHLPHIDDTGSKATCARLLSSATGSYIASIEVARHGYPRQYGTLARMVVETLATTIALVTNSTALKDFHDGKLKSTKCVTWTKKTGSVANFLFFRLLADFATCSSNKLTAGCIGCQLISREPNILKA